MLENEDFLAWFQRLRLPFQSLIRFVLPNRLGTWVAGGKM
jgi:hypothetical protein